MLVIKGDFDVEDDRNVWESDLTQLHISCHFPHEDVCLSLRSHYKEESAVFTDCVG